MSVTLQCPKLSCRAILQVPNAARGKRVRCSKCGATFLVPLEQTGKPKTTPTGKK